MSNELPKRKNLRLENYNYSGNGCYFITICTYNKTDLFGRYNVGAIHESPARSVIILFGGRTQFAPTGWVCCRITTSSSPINQNLNEK